jgi:hypothetical protein
MAASERSGGQLVRSLHGPALASALLLLGLLTAGRAVAAEDDSPLPGYWELSNTWIFIFHFKSVEKKCFTADDVAGVLQGPSNAHYACTYPRREVGDGHLQLVGTCVEKRGQVAQITASGTYGPEAFRLDARLSTTIAGIRLVGEGRTEARRLSETCPAESPKPGRKSGR